MKMNLIIENELLWRIRFIYEMKTEMLRPLNPKFKERPFAFFLRVFLIELFLLHSFCRRRPWNILGMLS
jgi:hypothetical protein